jgi:hypothetical protein
MSTRSRRCAVRSRFPPILSPFLRRLYRRNVCERNGNRSPGSWPFRIGCARPAGRHAGLFLYTAGDYPQRPVRQQPLQLQGFVGSRRHPGLDFFRPRQDHRHRLRIVDIQTASFDRAVGIWDSGQSSKCWVERKPIRYDERASQAARCQGPCPRAFRTLRGHASSMIRHVLAGRSGSLTTERETPAPSVSDYGPNSSSGIIERSARMNCQPLDFSELFGPLRVNVTTNPTAEWVARQLTEVSLGRPALAHPRSGRTL